MTASPVIPDEKPKHIHAYIHTYIHIYTLMTMTASPVTVDDKPKPTIGKQDPADARTSPHQDTPTADHTTRDPVSPNTSNQTDRESPHQTDRQSPHQTDRQSPKPSTKFPGSDTPLNKVVAPDVSKAGAVTAKKPSGSESKDPAPVLDKTKPVDADSQKDAGNSRGYKAPDVSKDQIPQVTPMDKNKVLDNIRKDLEGKNEASWESAKGTDKPEIATGRSVRSAKEGMLIVLCVCMCASA